MPSKFLQDGSRNLQLLLDRLIGIGSCAYRDILPGFDLPKLLAQQISRVLLGKNLLLKFDAIPHLHELVRVARIAILAGEFATPIRIDGPGKWHEAATAAVQ